MYSRYNTNKSDKVKGIYPCNIHSFSVIFLMLKKHQVIYMTIKFLVIFQKAQSHAHINGVWPSFLTI